MPNTKSAEKALRQNIKRRKVNLARKKTVRGAIKNYRRLLESGKTEDAKKQLPMVYKKIDKLAKVCVINSGKADRLKSRLAKKLNPPATKESA